MAVSVNKNTRELSDRVAVVTGASRGIGKAIAVALAEQGAAVGICARDERLLQATADEITGSGGRCVAIPCDVRSEESVHGFFKTMQAELGQTDILVNNAGVYRTEAVEDHSLPVWHEVIETNLTGTLLFCRSVISQMKAKAWGRIINISSVSGRTGEIWGSAYSASKFGMIGLTQSLALEIAKHGVTVNAVCPGWVETEMSQEQLRDSEWCKLNGMDPNEAAQNACFSVPQERFIDPREVADLVCYLSSHAARGITGQSINVCGGLSLN